MANEGQHLAETTCERCTPAAHAAFAVAYEAAWRAGFAAGRRAEARGDAEPSATRFVYRG